ncbi:MAG: hypothetical protein Q7T78_05220 [Rhodoferax sp.]|nr:hypothetical protein [Rhodoferax sp.]
MGQLVFMRRTPSEVEKFGGEVFIDIDGKNIGKLGPNEFEASVSEGAHLVKMYKSHKYETFIGFAESKLNVAEGDKLLIRYSAPMVVSQPGNMVITDYDSQVAEHYAENRELGIRRDTREDSERVEESNRKSSNATVIVVVIMVVSTIIWMVSLSKSMSMLSH